MLSIEESRTVLRPMALVDVLHAVEFGDYRHRVVDASVDSHGRVSVGVVDESEGGELHPREEEIVGQCENLGLGGDVKESGVGFHHEISKKVGWARWERFLCFRHVQTLGGGWT